MTTQEITQQDVIDSLAETWGRVSIRDGFSDGHVTVTTPSGCEYTVNQNGRTTKVSVNFSIDWSK
jgi:hypothetical protein